MLNVIQESFAAAKADWCFLFNVWGQGGVGKSTLLRQFRRLAEEAGFLTAYTSDSDSTVLEVMRRVAEQLEQQGHRLGPFAERYKVYLQKTQFRIWRIFSKCFLITERHSKFEKP